MKKTTRMVMLVAVVIMSTNMLLMFGCKKRRAPSAPYSVSASVSGSTIRLTWSSVEDADTYLITDGDGYNLAETYGTSYTDNYPSEGTNYYRVYARNDYGKSSSYGSASCYYSGNNGGSGGGSGSDLPVPTGVSAEVSGSKIYVTWNGTLNAGYYNVYRSTSSNGPYSEIGYVNHAYTYYYDDSPNTDNYYKITSYTYPNESEMSSYAYCHYSSGGSGGGSGSAPSAPTGVSAEVIGSRIYVSWNGVSDADEYWVYWTNNMVDYGFSKLGSTSNTYYYDDNHYRYNYYKIVAKNSYGTSPYSSYAYVEYNSGGGGGGNTVYSPCPVHYTSHIATSYQITLRWTNPTTFGCGTPTTAYLRVKHPDTYDYVTLETLSGSATSASFSYGMWANSEGYVYCGIITENSSGTSGGLPMVYNWKTDTWYGGNGKQYTEMMEQEEFGFSNINH